MKIYIQEKTLGKKIRELESRPVELEPVPGTLRELVEMLVCGEVEAHKRRVREAAGERIITEEQIGILGEVGKISFGYVHDKREADPENAVKTALEAVQDGLVRIFLNDQQVDQPDTPLDIREGDRITILRLTMLTGGFF